MYQRTVLLWCAVCLFAAPIALADLAPWTTHSTIKVRPFEEPANVEPHIYSAQNEWEALQVIVADDAGDALTNCDVTLEPLTGPGTDIEDIELYRETYIWIEYPSRKPADPAVKGWWPDGMIPFVDHYFDEDRDGAPFDVEEGWNQPIFVDIYVPEDQTPGDYAGTIEVTCDDHAAVQIPMTLTVWGFALPDDISLPSNYGFSCGTVYSEHQAAGGITPRNELTQLYYEEALRHRMMFNTGFCENPQWTWDPETKAGSFDMTGFDEQAGPVFDGTLYRDGMKFETYRTPYPPGGASHEERIAFWATLAQEFKDRGWFDKMYLYLPDEPTPDEYQHLVDLAAQLHEADPDYRAMATEQIEEALTGSVDIWCPDEPLFSDSLFGPPFPEDYTERQALGEEVWWYNCTSAQVLFDFANHFTDGQGMYMRIWFWLTRRYNFDGILFWHSVWLYAHDSDDPWVDQYADRFLCNGDGTMFYPGTVPKIGGTTDIPAPSLKLKLFREGMEDYEYFRILDGMGYADFVQQEVEKRAWKSYQWEHDALVVERSRQRLAKLILGELDIDAPPAPGGIAAAAGVGEISLAWNPVDDKDVAGYEVSLARYADERVVVLTTGADAQTATFTGLEIGKPYYLTVRAFDADENIGPWGEEVSATPAPPDTGDDDDASDDDTEPPDDGDGGGDDDDDGCGC